MSSATPSGHRPAALEPLKITKDGSVVGIQRGTNWRGWNTISGEQIPTPPPDLGPFAGALVVETKKYSLAKRDKDVLITGSARAETLRLSHTGEVMSATFNAERNCVLTASSFAAAASGEAPAELQRRPALGCRDRHPVARMAFRYPSVRSARRCLCRSPARPRVVLKETALCCRRRSAGPEDALILFASERVASRKTHERLYGHAAYDGPLRACSSRICRRYTPGDAPRYFRKKRLK